MKKDRIFLLLALLVFSFYLWDVGNPSSIRQGTEGLYLAISNEMYQAHNILAPLYKGEITWTKPPLHFWLTFPFYLVSSSTSLTAGRAAMATVGFALIIMLVWWAKKYIKSARLEYTSLLFFFATSLGLLRFSRLYMMEITLAAFTAAGALFYYHYLEDKSKKNFFLAVFLMGLSALVKGPVSLAMIFGGGFLFHSLEYYFWQKKIPWKTLFRVGLMATFIASLWYLICALKYGPEILNYFFIRENFGKFTAKSYPVSSVFIGLFLYALPWALLIPSALFAFFKEGKKSFSEKNRAELFLFCLTIVSFTLWLIPKQRSVHYAMPAIPFLLLFLLTRWDELKTRSLFWFNLYLIVGILQIFSLVPWFIPAPQGNLILYIIPLLAFPAYYFIRKKMELPIFVNLFLLIALFWIKLVPAYNLPLVSEEAKNAIHLPQLKLVILRPYFFQEELNYPVVPVAFEEIDSYLKTAKGNQVIISESDYHLVYDSLEIKAPIKVTWPKWIRKVSKDQIMKALSERQLAPLQEQYYLLEY